LAETFTAVTPCTPFALSMMAFAHACLSVCDTLVGGFVIGVYFTDAGAVADVRAKS